MAYIKNIRINHGRYKSKAYSYSQTVPIIPMNRKN